ncbi:hypothetical protein GCM10027068_06160 [Prescottella soli]
MCESLVRFGVTHDQGSSFDGGGSMAVVKKCAAGTSTPATLPFSGFRGLTGIELDGGRVYIAD